VGSTKTVPMRRFRFDGKG